MADVLTLLKEDVERIYLGNLSTVEADITLPQKGDNGTVFSWSSSAEYLISDSGKVTRPQFGAGNRKVTLTLTAVLENESLTKEYEANVLQREYPYTILSAYPINVYTKIGQKPHLPGVCVVKNNLGEDAMVAVAWDEIDSADFEKENTFTVKGKVTDDVFCTANVTVTNDEALLCPKIKCEKNAQAYSINDVKLLPDSDFYAQQERVKEYFYSVDDDSMLYNFRIAAGLDTKGAKPMTGWDAPECHLKGHTTGHYLSGLALCYGSTGDEKIKQKLDYMVDGLYICQQEMAKQPDKFAPGFLSGYDESQFDLLEVYTTYPTIWAPYYTYHKILAGLRECYIYGKNEKALEIAKNMGLWVYNRLSKTTREQRDKMWAMYIAGEFGGINETLVDLYNLTGEEKLLCASKFFDNDKLYLPMKMNIDALGNLHANQHIPQIIGVLKQFLATGEKERYDIANNFWNFVTGSHIYSIGGTGETEMFKPAGQIAKYISEKTAESCASYNMLKLSGMLYEYTPDVKYMHYYEKDVLNHILSCGDHSGPTGGSTYFMPSNPGGQKGFDLTENSCCHGTGYENHFKYADYVYAHSNEATYVNLFVPTHLAAENADIITNTCVNKEDITVNITVNKVSTDKVLVRKPLWSEDITVYLNGEKTNPEVKDGYYVFSINKGEIKLVCRCFGYLSACVDDEKTASICWGPYVLAAISEKEDYFVFDKTSQDVKNELVHQGGLEFTFAGEKFKPLNQINDEHYHLYVKFN